MNLLLLMSMIRFNDTFLFTAGLAFFIGGVFTGSIVSFFLFGVCLGTLIRHSIQDFKKKN
jgi:hypothetical protein